MRNLILLSCVRAFLPELEDVDAKMAVDEDTGTVYVNTKTAIIGVDVSCDEKKFSITFGDLGQSNITITGMQFLQGEESLCIASKHGDLLIINISTKMVECVGTVDSGLIEMKWSPDQELVLLATGHDTVIAMTRDFDPVAEVNITTSEFGKGEFVNVGWGKKETQFHGSEGKAAAKLRVTTIEPALPWDDKKVRIVWRGDGQYFAVSVVDPIDGNRKFRVWNRECSLQYTSEYVSGLESAFAWRPSGNLLVSSQRKPHRHDIVFFEKNGLQHGEFTLPFRKDEVKVKQLEWNSDSSVLAIWLIELPSDADEDATLGAVNHLQLWTMSNYHWYLKQSLDFPKENGLACVQWDSEHSHHLHVVCANGHYYKYIYGRTINDSTYPTLSKDFSNQDASTDDDGVVEKNLSFVAVIDGNTALMTPFQVMVVPPPMSAYKLVLPEPINAVRFLLSENHPNDVAVFMKSGKVALFTTQENLRDATCTFQTLSVMMDAAGGNGFCPRITPHIPCALLEINVDKKQLSRSALHHWIWPSQSQMFAISPSVLPGTDTVVLFEIDRVASQLVVSKSLQVDGLVLSSSYHGDDSIVLQMQDGSVKRCEIPSLNVTDYLPTSEKVLKLPRPCSYLSSCTFSGQQCIVALSEHSRLYINETEIASDCSSFCIHDDFLFLTTHAHTLRCINRKVPLKEIQQYFNSPLEARTLLQNCAIVETHRAVERGSRIVTVTPSDCRLVLQMPRGNLEQIHPRCLVLSLTTRHIESLEYYEAFAVMKKHRISMNLFFDINRKLFEENTQKFISDLKTTSNINIFIGDLQNEDLTQTMYKQYFPAHDKSQSSPSAITESSRKINKVCDLLIAELKKDPKSFIMSLVTAHIKKAPSEVGQALSMIKYLSETLGHDQKLISDVLKYMTVLVEGNKLFNEALGTYDFKLVVMVAEKSQLDPKEYMPMLRDLQKHEDEYRKYMIDLRLRRFSAALKHVAKCADHFDECMELIIKHEMYREALKLFGEDTENHATICSSYGDFLLQKHKYEEAGTMFSRCGKLRSALECFTQSDNSSLALSAAFKLKLGDAEFMELIYKLSDHAKNTGRHRDAVDLLEHHARDIELAVEVALHARDWSSAVRMTEQHQRQDLNETHVIPSLTEAFEQTCLVLQSHHDVLVKHTIRLQTVRQNKERQQMQSLLEGVDGMGMDSDLYSDTSSTMASSTMSCSTSNASRSTGRTAKSRRKKERRGHSLKEGSRFEDLALLHSLKVTIKAVDDLSDDVRSLCLHLCFFRCDNLAQQLQNLYSEVRNSVMQRIPVIWSQSILQNNGLATGPRSTVNSILASVSEGSSGAELNEQKDDKQQFQDVELFIPPKFNTKCKWTVNMYEKS